MLPGFDVSPLLPSRKLKFLKSTLGQRGRVWEVEKPITRAEECPKCKTLCSTLYGRARSVVRDEPLRNESLFLKIKKHRYFCKVCRKPFTERVQGIEFKKKTTQRYRKFIAHMSEEFTNLQGVKKKYNCSSGLIYNVFYEQQELKLRERKNQPWPEVIGIDEHFFSRRKGYTEFCTVFTDMKGKRLFEMVLGKDSKTLFEKLGVIPGREKVRLVVMDLSSSYRSFVQKMFPQAEIVADKFHTLRLLTPHLLKTRKSIHGHRQEMRTRKLLLCNRMRLDYFLRCDIDRYLKDHPKLKELYYYKEKLHQFYRTKGVVRAAGVLHKLIEELKARPYEELQRLGKTLQRWRKEILLYFATGLTNARTEAFNKTAKLVQRRACGYKNFENYRLRTLNACR
jgi:transposase